MRLSVYALAVGGGTLAQSALAPAVGIGGVVPDVLVLVVLFLALRRGPETGCLTGFGLGLVQDVLGGGPLGLHALAKAVTGFAAGDLPRWFLVARPPVVVLAAVLATVGDGVLRFLLLQLFHYPAPLGELMTRVILPQAGYNGVLTALALAVPGLRVRA